MTSNKTSDPQVNEAELKCVEHLKQIFPQSALDPDDTHFLDESTYLRFARARNADPAKASEMLKNCIEWRKSFKPHHITHEDVKKAMDCLTFTVAGRCRAGRPLLIMTIGVPNPCEVTERVKQLVYIMEEFHRKGYGRLTWIIDFSEMGKHPRDQRSGVARKEIMKMMQDYYPDLLGALLLYRTPWYVRALYTVSRPFIDAQTRQKIYFLGSDEKLLFQYVDKDAVPPRLGGTLAENSEETLSELPNAGITRAAKCANGKEKEEEEEEEEVNGAPVGGTKMEDEVKDVKKEEMEAVPECLK